MKGPIRAVAPALAALGLLNMPALAQPAYRLVAQEDVEQLRRELEAAGSNGYRFLFAGEGLEVSGKSRIVALLERGGDGRRDYSVLHLAGSLSDPSTREAVETQAALGYRLPAGGIIVRRRPAFWLPDSEYEDQTVLIFERSDPAPRYQYEAIGFGSFSSLHRSLAERRAEGYEVLGLWNTARKLEVVLERRMSAAPPTDSEVSDDEFRLLLLATRAALRSKLNRAAGEGYRLVDAEDPPTTGPPILLLRKSAARGTPIEYRFTDKVPDRMREDVLEKQLNRRSRKGWRLPDEGITHSVLTLERVAKPKKTDPYPRYHLVSSNEAEELPRALERSVNEGYQIVRLFVEPSRTTVLLVNDATDRTRGAARIHTAPTP